MTADELDTRVRALEAERVRPIPPPPPTTGGSLVGLQRLLDLQTDTETSTEGDDD